MAYTFVTFLQEVLPILGLRWAGFRKVRGQVRKRVSSRQRELGLPSLESYRIYLDHYPDEWSILEKLCRVTISRFYRDRALYDRLRDSILPLLFKDARVSRRPSVRAWSAGCASGEEAYSVSLCARLGPSDTAAGPALEILGTDIDEYLIERARVACYPLSALRELPDGWLEAGFEVTTDHACLRSQFRKGISWDVQDLGRDLPSGRFDLILCRNLAFTYFDQVRQEACLRRLLGCLRRGGFLVIGGHESLPQGDWDLEPIDAKGLIQRYAG
jgi:chemotaxis protein methyltransferase CheR